MPNCKICRRAVLASLVVHTDCLERLISEVEETFCDEYCKWPYTAPGELEAACGKCPLGRMEGLVKDAP